MSIGEVLEAARRQAGLTVTQVSQRTRIRETIIRGIERDDFSASARAPMCSWTPPGTFQLYGQTRPAS